MSAMKRFRSPGQWIAIGFLLVGLIALGWFLITGLPTDTSQPVKDSFFPERPETVVDRAPSDPLPVISPGIIIIGVIILVSMVLFVTEWIPLDITAIGIMLSLIFLEPWTGVSAQDGISGFASTATITVLAMFMLAEGVQRTGVLQTLGEFLVRHMGNSLKRQLGLIVGITSPASGIINNTAVVAILLPTVTNIAEKCRRSPSKLLIPLSYASMFGGMLTVVGTSTNLLASDLSERLLNHPIGMFEFTSLGLLVTVVGAMYLIFLAPKLLKERVLPESKLTDRYEMKEFLTEIEVSEDSPLAGKTVEKTTIESGHDADIIQLVRDQKAFIQPINDKEIRPGDHLVVRSDQATLLSLLDMEGTELAAVDEVTEEKLTKAEDFNQLVEVIVAPGSRLVGENLKSSSFRSEFDATVLAIRHGQELQHTRMDNKEFTVGDTLLIQASPEALQRIRNGSDFYVVQEIEQPNFRRDRVWHALGIIFAVITAAGTGLVHIMTAALTGAVLMVLTGCLRPREMYKAVHWDVIFLIAALIPLGLAMENTGAADLIAGSLVGLSEYVPVLAMLGIMYFLTAFLTNLISNNASVLLMIPIAIDLALRLESNPFAFLLAVTFAASTAFMSPMGYQTNLFVHGPGGYKFIDYIKVGAPLQVILGLVTTFGIAYLWPL